MAEQNGAVDPGLAAPTSRNEGTLVTEFSANYVPPALMPGYQGHVPGVAYSFGSPYGTTTLKYFQDYRNAAMEKSHTIPSGGSRFHAVFSTNPTMVLSDRSQSCDHWPAYSTRFNLDSNRTRKLTGFYQSVQQHRKHYLDKTGTVPRVPYFLLPVRERDRYPLPTDLPPLCPKKKQQLLRASPANLKTYQTYPSGKRVSSQERQKRDCYFEFRA